MDLEPLLQGYQFEYNWQTKAAARLYFALLARIDDPGLMSDSVELPSSIPNDEQPGTGTEAIQSLLSLRAPQTLQTLPILPRPDLMIRLQMLTPLATTFSLPSCSRCFDHEV
ncbi:uncharacterized protein N7483_000201 [Penicillium malachiteum]|uniref:uncharacterized protein n=1 Tax=Penicillium malachiteum TaxID=1324776 RepID=UPI002547B8EF|nr:uncharacterized protein N7483_000201 [Penicillium malachiteum]KAJ5735076.1 hypothetical protein N7483_000201 [Penicillium malachiteum]